MTAFDTLWPTILEVGRNAGTGGYRRFAWSDADLTLREWFTGCAESRAMDVEVDRNGNMWAWWMPPGWTGDPRGAFVTGSHLDSVPDGGAFDGPLGVVSAFSAIDIVRERGVVPTIPVAVVAFSDEEGARFGVACVGSQLSTGALSADRARGLRDIDGITLAEALARVGRDPQHLGEDPQPGRSRRGIHRIACGAGPCPGSGGRSAGRGVGDLATRAVGVHVRRRSQPRRVDASCRPPRSHARLRVVGSLRAGRGRCARRRCDLRQGHRRTQRGQCDSLGGSCLAGRQGGGRGNADVPGGEHHGGGAAPRRTRLCHPRRHRRIDHPDSAVPGRAARTTDEGARQGRRHPCAPHRGGARCRHPVRAGADRDAVRAQPNRCLPLARGARRDGRLQSSVQRPSPTSWPTGSPDERTSTPQRPGGANTRGSAGTPSTPELRSPWTTAGSRRSVPTPHPIPVRGACTAW